MALYNFTKFIGSDKLTKEIEQAGLTTLSYIETVGAQVSIVFLDDLSSEQQTELTTIVSNHNALTQEETVRIIIKNARVFGNQIIEDFAVQNVMLGITQDGLTGHVRQTCSEVIDCLVTGSLYDAIAQIKAIPTEAKDPKYLSNARLTEFCNRIESYLGVPLSTISDP